MKFKSLTNVTIYETIPAGMTTIRTSRNQKGRVGARQKELKGLSPWPPGAKGSETVNQLSESGKNFVSKFPPQHITAASFFFFFAPVYQKGIGRVLAGQVIPVRQAIKKHGFNCFT